MAAAEEQGPGPCSTFSGRRSGDKGVAALKPLVTRGPSCDSSIKMRRPARALREVSYGSMVSETLVVCPLSVINRRDIVRLTVGRCPGI
jgi:hypothetical protein